MNSLNSYNAPTLPVTTQPQQVPHRITLEYTCNCDADAKKDAATAVCCGLACGTVGALISSAMTKWSLNGALIGGLPVFTTVTLVSAGVLSYADRCSCIKLRARQVEIVELAPTAGGQQQSQDEDYPGIANNQIMDV